MFDLQDSARRAGELEAAILQHLRHHTHVSAEQLLQEMESEPGLSRTTLNSLLENLERRGKVRRMAMRTGTNWCIRHAGWGLPFLP